MTVKSSKLYIALKNRLHGMSFYRAMSALELARKVHKGFRKDNETPEYQHQLEMALHAFTLKGVENILEELLVQILLHDVKEDYAGHMIHFGGASMNVDTYITSTFGLETSRCLTYLDKNSTDKTTYFKRLEEFLLPCLAKLVDRCNNFQSMKRGNFSLEKQKNYADEVEFTFLPMAKRARKNFPEYTDAFYALEHMLKNQLEFVRNYLSLAQERSAQITFGDAAEKVVSETTNDTDVN